MPSSCKFELDRPTAVYYSCETVNGRVILITMSDKDVNDVTIRFEGEGKVRWTETRSRVVDGKSQPYAVYYVGHESYIKEKIVVHPKGKLPAGRHTWNFSIVLANECPTSCVGKYGQIMYELSLVLRRTLRFDNVYNQPITIIKQLDLNNHPELACPLKGEEVKNFCCWPCLSEPVIVTLSVPFGGYAPGQKIKYSIEVDNQSVGNDLDYIVLKLIRVFSFTATSPEHKIRCKEDIIDKVAHEDRYLRLSKKLVKGVLVIPAVPPTFATNIIGISYTLRLSVETGLCHRAMSLDVPITIGTVPLIQSARIAVQRPSATIMPPTLGVPEIIKPPFYDLLKPPSFEDAMATSDRFIDTDVDERNRCDGFMPKYPMYTSFVMPTAPQYDNAGPLIVNLCSAQSSPYAVRGAASTPEPSVIGKESQQTTG